MSPGNIQSPKPGVVLQEEVDAVRRAWLRNPQDVGVGLYNPTTGEFHLGTFDTSGQNTGHDGLQLSLQIVDRDRPFWRGFIFTSDGRIFNRSGFNIVDGTGPQMRADYFREVEAALQQSSLI